MNDERVQGQGNRPAVRQLAMRQAIYRHAAPTPDRGFLPRLEATFLCFLGGEVATDEAPVGPVRRGVDIAAANAEKAVRLGGRRAAGGEGGAALDERAVREAAVGDEDERGAQEAAEGDDGAVARVQVADYGGGAAERQELCEEASIQKRRRACRYVYRDVPYD